MIRAAVFDLDDTLYNEKDYVFSGFKELDHWIQTEFNKKGFYHLAVDLFNSGEKKFVFNGALDLMDISYNQKTISEMVERYRSHDPDIYLLEDAECALDQLKNTVKIGLLSDGFFISQRKKVKALKLGKIFSVIVLSDQWGRENWKPSPTPYEQVRSALKCQHCECLYIGDNPNKDFITAKKLGWKTVQIKRPDNIYSEEAVEPSYQAHHQIHDLRELFNIINVNAFQ